MRAAIPPADVMAMMAQIEASVGIDDVRSLNAGFGAATPETVQAIVEEAAKFASQRLGPLNNIMDSEGCSFGDAGVRTSPGHEGVWREYVDGGWPTLDQPEIYGGQALPRVVTMAVQEIFDRANPAFGMLPVAQRSAARLIAAWGTQAVKAEWMSRLVSGEWSATICISEPEAGSDVACIRTQAMPDGAGGWFVTGEKCWISYGDHDLVTRIGHCVLARMPDAAPGSAGLSLFLVPDRLDGAANGVTVRRIEEKMGLHGSPTCALGFEGARAWLLGEPGRGLAQMFVMIANMRLSVAAAGLGIAGGCTDVALAYAETRRQGGRGPKPSVIAEHADVQRQLLEAVSRVESFRGLLLTTANLADIAELSPDSNAAGDADALTQWLLPIVKNTGAELGFEAASMAMQVLGGAGYTRDWPVEQALRDARVFSIFEGTTGMQALDLLHRRLLRGDRRGLKVFLTHARSEARLAGKAGGALDICLDELEASVQILLDRSADRQAVETVATPFLHLAALAAQSWIAARLLTRVTGPAATRLTAAGQYFLGQAVHRARSLSGEIGAPSSLDSFDDVRCMDPVAR